MKSKEEILEELIAENTNEKLLFEQYKLYVEMANNISERRDKANKFYLALISGVLTLVSIITSIKEFAPVIIVVLISNILICWNWYQSIQSYKRLNSSKFKVINSIENKLPVKGYTVEWDLIQLKGHKDLTNIEKNIPLYLLGLCIIFLILVTVQYSYGFLNAT